VGRRWKRGVGGGARGIGGSGTNGTDLYTLDLDDGRLPLVRVLVAVRRGFFSLSTTSSVQCTVFFPNDKDEPEEPSFSSCLLVAIGWKGDTLGCVSSQPLTFWIKSGVSDDAERRRDFVAEPSVAELSELYWANIVDEGSSDLMAL
jgi:hypothetical protein